MSESGLDEGIRRLTTDGASPDAVAVFAHHYRTLQAGETGLIRESDIEPIGELTALEDLDVDPAVAHEAFAATAVIKLNGGLATSMGLDRAKSLLPVKDGYSFLQIILRQLAFLREQHDVRLPLLFMNSFRTRADTLAVLDAEAPAQDVPVDFLQNRIPKLRSEDLAPVDWPADPDLQWCPPGHADVYPALRGSGTLDALLAAGYRYAFISNADNLGSTPQPHIPGWMAAEGIPFVIESCRRTLADRKGGHLARRRADGRLVLRETAQTSTEDLAALQDLDKHRFCNTNNLWLDLRVLADVLGRSDGVLDLPLIRNVKTVDPADPASPEVVQMEAAMGAAVQVFDGARSVLVGRDRFLPVKTTNDLLLMRSDQYRLAEDGRVVAAPERSTDGDTFVDLDPRFYKVLGQFEPRFPAGPPSLKDCTAFSVRGDVTFGPGIVARGAVQITAT